MLYEECVGDFLITDSPVKFLLAVCSMLIQEKECLPFCYFVFLGFLFLFLQVCMMCQFLKVVKELQNSLILF